MYCQWPCRRLSVIFQAIKNNSIISIGPAGLVCLFCFIYIVPTHHSSANLASFCSRMFTGKEDHFFHQEFHNPLTKKIIEQYQIARDLKWFGNTKKRKEFEKGMKEMVEFLESPSIQNGQLKNLRVSLEDIVGKISEIMEFTKNLPKEEESVYFVKITQAVLAALNKHLPMIIKADANQVDWPRVNLILKQIAAFDMKSPRFSMYKIKRAIEGRYSLKEFILCRM